VLFGWLLLKQMLSNRELLGCLIMFVAIIISQIPFEEILKKKKLS
jgi:drug/metabolite transporter (DMT)-like permease